MYTPLPQSDMHMPTTSLRIKEQPLSHKKGIPCSRSRGLNSIIDRTNYSERKGFSGCHPSSTSSQIQPEVTLNRGSS